MKTADFVLPLLTPAVRDYSKYLRYKITGTMVLAYAYRLPMLWVADCPVKEWAPHSEVLSSYNDLATFLIRYKRKDGDKHSYYERASSLLGREVQSKQMLTFLRDIEPQYAMQRN
eukprot:SAG31_NODE_24876_length_472_cov_2.021448_1_plen_115_part_10